MAKNVQFVVVMVVVTGYLTLFVPPAEAFDYFNILTIPSKSNQDDESKLGQPTNVSELLQEHGGPLRLEQPNAQFDYFRLALQWPPTHCIFSRCTVSKLPLFFTIHGLWPDRYDGTILRNCQPDVPFQPITEPNLLQRLRTVWPNLQGDDSKFWQTQWERHGRCSIPRYEQMGFFKAAVDLYCRYDVIGAIRQSIPPNPGHDTYKKSQFVDTITRLTSKAPGLGCRAVTQGIALHEVHICFKNTDVREVIDCPANHNPTGNSKCPESPDSTIYFPIK